MKYDNFYPTTHQVRDIWSDKEIHQFAQTVRDCLKPDCKDPEGTFVAKMKEWCESNKMPARSCDAYLSRLGRDKALFKKAQNSLLVRSWRETVRQQRLEYEIQQRLLERHLSDTCKISRKRTRTAWSDLEKNALRQAWKSKDVTSIDGLWSFMCDYIQKNSGGKQKSYLPRWSEDYLDKIVEMARRISRSRTRKEVLEEQPKLRDSLESKAQSERITRNASALWATTEFRRNPDFYQKLLHDGKMLGMFPLAPDTNTPQGLAIDPASGSTTPSVPLAKVTTEDSSGADPVMSMVRLFAQLNNLDVDQTSLIQQRMGNGTYHLRLEGVSEDGSKKCFPATGPIIGPTLADAMAGLRKDLWLLAKPIYDMIGLLHGVSP